MKKKLFGIFILGALIIVTIFKINLREDAEYGIYFANIEALAENESITDLDCQGWWGECAYDCPKCGLKWKADGSHVIGSHRCSQ